MIKITRNPLKHNVTNVSLLGLIVLLLFFTLVQTQYIQEDAFIYFQTARNFALYGEYSFNLGERYPAATSSLYGFIISMLIVAFGEFFILILQALNFSIAIMGAAALSASARTSDEGFPHFNPYIFLAIIISPPFLNLSTSGMETSFLFSSLSFLVFGVARRIGYVSTISAIIIALMRIEATIAVVLAALLLCIARDMRQLAWVLIGLVAGLILFICINLVAVGEILPQTITAKDAAYMPSRALGDIVERAWNILFEQSFFLGLSSRYIPVSVYIFIGFTGFSILILTFTRQRSFSSELHTHALYDLAPTLAATSIVAFATGYIYGGVVFPWYLWPSSAFTYFLAAHLAYRYTCRCRGIPISFLVTVGLAAIVNLMVMKSIGYQESQFRSSVGLYISGVADASDTLFLEPAGYIPFYAGLRTWDTVGLVSPDVLEFRSSDNPDWWMDFVRQYRPTWIVERVPLHVEGTPDATGFEGFSESERTEFNSLYSLSNTFNYREYLAQNSNVISPLYMLGNHSDYFLYRLRDHAQ